MINVFLCILHIEFQYVEIGGIMFTVLFKQINLKLIIFYHFTARKKNYFSFRAEFRSSAWPHNYA